MSEVIGVPIIDVCMAQIRIAQILKYYSKVYFQCGLKSIVFLSIT